MNETITTATDGAKADIEAQLRMIVDHFQEALSRLVEVQKAAATVAALPSLSPKAISSDPSVRHALEALQAKAEALHSYLVNPPGPGFIPADLTRLSHGLLQASIAPSLMADRESQAEARRQEEERARQKRADDYKAGLEEEERLHQARLQGANV